MTYRRFLDLKQAEEQAREARIQTALERVRAVAMAMRKSEEIINVCHVMYDELLALGFSNIRNAQIANNTENRQAYIICSYSDTDIVTLKEVPFNSSPIVKDLYEELERSKEAFYQREFKGQQFEDWRKWRKSMFNMVDARTKAATSLCFYLYSIENGHLGISTFNPITPEQVELLKRFKNVFELSYKRYEDVSKAEAQAREAQIQLALERVRARTMAMQHSDELSETAHVLHQQFSSLGEKPSQITIGIIKPEDNVIEFWGTDLSGNKTLQTAKGDLDEPILLSKLYAAWKKKEKSATVVLSGKELEGWIEYRYKISGLGSPPGYNAETRYVYFGFFSKAPSALVQKNRCQGRLYLSSKGSLLFLMVLIHVSSI
jgi:hypothetical protein